MKIDMHAYLRAFAAVISCSVSLALAGCGGGGQTSMNTTVLPQATGDEVLQSEEIDKPKALGVMSKVTGAAAYYTAVSGKPQPQMKTARPESQRGAMAAQDLSYFGGPTLVSESAYNIYINCGSANCWGAPGSFLAQLASSTFIHLLDQYIGSTVNGRYTYGAGILANYNTSGTLQDQDIYNIVHSVAQSRGTGYGRIYNVFLMNGVSQCSSAVGGCYRTDYCAYHGSVDFSDIGHTLYTVEPYQGINGCMSPNGVLADSTNSTLSHEYFETITDPDVQSNLAWYNNTYGEIGDICRTVYGNIRVGGVLFDMQKEWSNYYHACASRP